MCSFARLSSLKSFWEAVVPLDSQDLLLILGIYKGLNSEEQIQTKWRMPVGLCWDLDLDLV